MKPTFASARLLLARAKTHLAEFEAVAGEFSKKHPYTQFRENDPATGKILFKARIKPIPEELSPIAFDILNCLRSSLDHAVFDASVILGGKPKPKYTKFPFGKTRADAKKDLPRKRAEVPEELGRYLLRFKPYKRGNRPLWALNELRNEKIHRTLSVMAAVSQSVSFSPSKKPGGGFIEIDHLQPRWDSRKMELTYMTVAAVEDFNMQITIEVLVTFGSQTPFARKPAIPVFHKLVSIADGIIVGIETKTLRIKGG